MTAPRKPKRRHPALVLTALLLGIVLLALLAEGAFRLFWHSTAFAASQPIGMYVAATDGEAMLTPGFRGTQGVGDQHTSIVINALGMRGPEVAPKRAGERRLLVLGDGLVFGDGVDADATLPAQLQVALAQQLSITVGNGGVPGNGSRNDVANMERLDKPFAADAFVFCGSLGDDAVDDTEGPTAVYAGRRLTGAMATLVRTSWRMRLALRSRAAAWFEDMLCRERPQWSPLASYVPSPELLTNTAGLPPANQRMAGLFLDVVDEKTTWQPGTPPLIPRLADYLRKSLTRAKEIAGARPLVFVVLPTAWHCDEPKRIAELQQMGLDPKQFERGLSQRRWLDLAKDLGIPALDATPILVAAGETKDLFIHDGGHFAKRGNEVVARWLASELPRLLR